MKNIIVITLLSCSILNATAQNIEGKVLEILENGNTSPILGANVYWEGTLVGTTTNVNGEYSIKEPPSLPATLNVSYVGHTLESKEVVNNEYIFYLTQSIDLDEVEIAGEINTTKISTIEPLNIQTISAGEIQKAACCNLSECFETNNTVDISYSDGVSGIKKIQMLGLDGKYIQITNELIPLIRGMQRSYGLSYIPGSWIESIQIIQGAGSVVNGFESFTGQINLEYFKPEAGSGDKLNWNLYTNSEGKLENNLMLTKKNGNWKSNLFTHVSYFDREIDHHGSHHDHSDHSDRPGDKFLDMPKIKQFSLLNRWKYYGSEKYRLQTNLRGIIEERVAGQITTDQNIANPYLINVDNQIIQVYTKLGKIKSDKKSIGSQTSFTLHNQKAKFGNNIYTGIQESFSINIVEQNQLNDKHLVKYGGSYFADRFTESFEGNTNQPFLLKKRVDLVTGLFSEHQYQNEKINIITGFRADYYNIEDKIYYSPRLNIKYNPGDRTAIRFSMGEAFRVSNFITENMNYLASSREIIFTENLKAETALNYGLNIAHCFYFLNKEGTVNFDIYNTVFDNQIVVNIENKDVISFKNLDGNSYATSIQLGLDYKIIDQLQIRLGYKINNTVSTFNGIEKELPLQPKTRGLLNFAYSTNSDKWHFDITGNYIGESRIPENIVSDDVYSASFVLFNTQVTRKWTDFDVYIGGENLSNYTQPDPIIDAGNPFGTNFDASLIWGPVMGRNIYAGLRYKIE
ncbi:MAG: TonB-dependent receptor [Bacteroidota bacterium]|nr:TonB-dependent receptor [Bacteroidota bacterium]